MRTITTHTKTTNYITIESDDGSEETYEVDFSVTRIAAQFEPFISEDGRTIRFALDESHRWVCNDYEWPEGVEFVQGNPLHHHYMCETEAREWIEQANADSNLAVFPVGVYEHGMVEYSLAGESGHSSDQWDYAVGAAIVIPTGPEGFTDPEAAARAILREYTDWCNGETYEVVELLKNDTGLVPFMSHGCGTIGAEQTQEIITNGY